MLFSAMEGSWRRAPALCSVWFVSLCRLFLCDWSTNWLTNQSMQMWKCAGQIQGHMFDVNLMMIDLSLLSLQLRSIRSTRRRALGSAALWVERSCGRSELSLRAPKPSTADAASTRRSNADDPGSRRPWRLLRLAFVPLRAKRRDGTPRIPAAFTCLYSSPLCCLLVDVGVTRSSLSSVAPFASSMWIQQLLVSIKDPEGWAELPWRVVE